MIDWTSVALNFSWIFGLALLLAQFSYNRWLAQETDAKRPVLTFSTFVIGVVGRLFIAAGLIGLSSSWVERLIWLIVGGLMLGLHIWEYSAAKSGNRSTRSYGD